MTALLITAALAAAPLDATSYCLHGRMADGTQTRAGSVAHNGYPLGTRIRVWPPIFGQQRWVVRDRIAWGTSIDFWAPSCALSRAFGRRRVSVAAGWPQRLQIGPRHLRKDDSAMPKTNPACRSLQDAVAGAEQPVLRRIDRGGIHASERELRYQLEHKDGHPLARSPELLDVLAELEQRALITSELCLRLTARGQQRLAELEAP
jgi:hypothetical protein